MTLNGKLSVNSYETSKKTKVDLVDLARPTLGAGTEADPDTHS